MMCPVAVAHQVKREDIGHLVYDIIVSSANSNSL